MGMYTDNHDEASAPSPGNMTATLPTAQVPFLDSPVCHYRRRFTRHNYVQSPAAQAAIATVPWTGTGEMPPIRLALQMADASTGAVADPFTLQGRALHSAYHAVHCHLPACPHLHVSTWGRQTWSDFDFQRPAAAPARTAVESRPEAPRAAAGPWGQYTRGSESSSSSSGPVHRQDYLLQGPSRPARGQEGAFQRKEGDRAVKE